MDSREYWTRRQVANEAKAVRYTEAQLRTLGRHYKKATKEIDSEVAAFYKKHAGADGKIDMASASIHVRSNLTRLDDLRSRIQQQLGDVIAVERTIAKDTLSSVYEEGFYKSSYDLQRYRNGLRPVSRLTPSHVDAAINTAWSGRHYSARIWARQQKLTKAVDDIVTQGVILGRSNERMAQQLADRMNGSYSNAKRLIRTESNYVHNQGTLLGYEAGGIEEYEYLSTLDMRTSDICQSLDGQRFKLTEARPGENYPPMHPNCRSTTVPYFPDEDDAGQRIARDPDGSTSYVRGDMTYEEWREQFIVPDESDHGTIDSNSQFSQSLDHAPGMTKSYKQALVNKHAAADPDVQRVYDKYIPDNVVSVSNNANAHYKVSAKPIELDFADDLNNPRGSGVTFFHEHGHYVDHAAGTATSGRSAFISEVGIGNVAAGDYRRAIFDDVQSYIDNFRQANNLTLQQARRQISARLQQGNGAIYDAVSDLYDGVTGGAVGGRYGHSRRYWQRTGSYEREAFAHMFESSFDDTGTRKQLLQEFFPSSYAVFLEMMGAM